jgi:hypothetical protein
LWHPREELSDVRVKFNPCSIFGISNVGNGDHGCHVAGYVVTVPEGFEIMPYVSPAGGREEIFQVELDISSTSGALMSWRVAVEGVGITSRAWRDVLPHSVNGRQLSPIRGDMWSKLRL